MIIIETIRENLNEAIKTSGYTITEIAKKLNIKQPTVSQYLSGRAMPALDTFANLCQLLDVDANEILGISAVNYKTKNRIEFNIQGKITK